MNKYLFTIMLVCSISFIDAYNALSIEKLTPYKQFLEDGTYNRQDWSKLAKKPLSRYNTLAIVFTHLENKEHPLIIELGTTHSFVDGQYEGCDSNNTKYWQPHNPRMWDWGAGYFTLMAAECLYHLKPIIYTVDIDHGALNRCRIMTASYKDILNYHQ